MTSLLISNERKTWPTYGLRSKPNPNHNPNHLRTPYITGWMMKNMFHSWLMSKWNQAKQQKEVYQKVGKRSKASYFSELHVWRWATERYVVKRKVGYQKAGYPQVDCQQGRLKGKSWKHERSFKLAPECHETRISTTSLLRIGKHALLDHIWRARGFGPHQPNSPIELGSQSTTSGWCC